MDWIWWTIGWILLSVTVVVFVMDKDEMAEDHAFVFLFWPLIGVFVLLTFFIQQALMFAHYLKRG